MSELLTAAQMRAIEAAAIASGEVTGLELMERAGRGVVEAIFAEWPELAATLHRAVVLCGPGNNGGDGFVVARLLRERGWAVEVFLYGEPDRLPPDARANHERWRKLGKVRKLGYPTLTRAGLQALRACWSDGRPDIVVDAIFGTGLSRPADALGPLFDTSKHTSGNTPTRVVAVDVPTGMCSDSGRLFPRGDRQDTPHAVICADLTVAFHRAKVGHYLDRAPLWCGKVVVVDIGLDGLDVRSDAAGQTVSLLPDLDGWSHAVSVMLLPKRSGHKFSHGHALIVSGPPGHGGAARLAARSSLRIGAGLVTVGCPAEALVENAARLDAVMLREVGDGTALRAELEDKRINALCLGPGLGQDARGRALVAEVLGAGDGVLEPRPTVLDADALSVLAREPALFAQLHDRCILTPHAGEFARLFPDIAAKLDAPPTQGPVYSKVDACREAAARAGCVVLFKGPDTVIAAPDGRSSVNSADYDRAAPWLATAGSGDVLAGFITGLLARGFAPMEAAGTAAWLHVACAQSFGPGLIAEDLPEELPKVFRALGL